MIISRIASRRTNFNQQTSLTVVTFPFCCSLQCQHSLEHSSQLQPWPSSYVPRSLARPSKSPAGNRLLPPSCCAHSLIHHRYTDLQPVGMGAFGLVWYRSYPICPSGPTNGGGQLCKRPTYWAIGGGQKDYEALQHSGPFEENLQRAEATEASPS